MYVAVLTAIFGQAIWFRSTSVVVYGVMVALAFHLWIVAYEEPRLRALFGKEYEAYCARVGRWIP
jgi:protein-S-isoprenylcysteine O-methyltransferase Ste14